MHCSRVDSHFQAEVLAANASTEASISATLRGVVRTSAFDATRLPSLAASAGMVAVTEFAASTPRIAALQHASRSIVVIAPLVVSKTGFRQLRTSSIASTRSGPRGKVAAMPCNGRVRSMTYVTRRSDEAHAQACCNATKAFPIPALPHPAGNACTAMFDNVVSRTVKTFLRSHAYRRTPSRR